MVQLPSLQSEEEAEEGRPAEVRPRASQQTGRRDLVAQQRSSHSEEEANEEQISEVRPRASE